MPKRCFRFLCFGRRKPLSYNQLRELVIMSVQDDINAAVAANQATVASNSAAAAANLAVADHLNAANAKLSGLGLGVPVDTAALVASTAEVIASNAAVASSFVALDTAQAGIVTAVEAEAAKLG